MSEAIEKIYDAHVADEILKAGTKYERLAAIIFKVLEEDNTVIHDLRLKGDGKSASHQIDVTIEKQGSIKRILIECKDYDEVVGIGVIRDFYGAVAQIKPEEAIVVTTQGFTKGAVNFANDEKIKLAILRKVIDEDLENRIEEIVIRGHILTFGTPHILYWKSASDEDYDNFNKLSLSYAGKTVGTDTEATFFYDDKGKKIETFRAYLESFFNSLPREGNKTVEAEHLFPEIRYIEVGNQLIGVSGFAYRISFYENIIESILDVGKKIAVLLLKMLDGSLNKLFFDGDISEWTFDDSGEVVKKPERKRELKGQSSKSR